MADHHVGDDGVHYYKYIHSDSTALLLEKHRSTLTPEFNNVFGMISVINKLEGSPVLIDGRPGVVPTTKSSDNIAKEIERLLTLAQDQYILLSSQQKWNGVGHPGRSSFIVNNVSMAPSWNCGQEGHKLQTVRNLAIKQRMTTIVSSFGVAALVEAAEEAEAVVEDVAVMDVSINGVHQWNKSIICG